MHHVQAVVFHGVDEWGTAALDILRENRCLSLSLKALSIPPSGPASSSLNTRTFLPPWHPSLAPPPEPHLRAPDHAPCGLPRWLTTASMSAPRSRSSRTASWHPVFTATCRAVSPSRRRSHSQSSPGLGLVDAILTLSPLGTHLRNCEPPGPRSLGLRCPAGPAGSWGCGARMPGGLQSGRGDPGPWGWHQLLPVAGPYLVMW